MGSERVFRLPANGPATLLKRDLDTQDTPLVTLYLTNCLFADPDQLCSFIIGCTELRTLACVASRVQAPMLPRLMLRSLQHLTHLEFSIVDEDAKVAAQIAEIGRLDEDRLRRYAVASSVRQMYVEIAGDANFNVLEAILAYCPNLTDLHVHIVYGIFDNAVSRCSRILAGHRRVQTFTFTSEVPSPTPLEPPPDLEFEHCAGVCANVVYRRPGPTCNYGLLYDLATTTSGVLQSEPLVVVAISHPSLHQQIRQAVSRNNWSAVRTFCLVLLSPLDMGSFSHATASVSCDAALLELFQQLRNLTELNVNSFHCDRSLDLTEAISALSHLQALSLAPCALRHAGAVTRVAQACRKLQDLDIRCGFDGLSRACNICEEELHLDGSEMAALNISRSQGRLTLYSVPDLRSLKFSTQCLVIELRIFDDSACPLPDYKRLGLLLSLSRSLRVLVLKYRGLNFSSVTFQADIAKVDTLRYLCVLTDADLAVVAAKNVRRVVSRMPRLEAMHAHCRDRNDREHQITWLCPFDDSAAGPELNPATAEASQTHPPERGRIIIGKPCVLCSVQTFIGLAKPRNRGRKTAL